MRHTQPTALLDQVLDAHGGRDRWSRAKTIRARLTMTGPMWTMIGQGTAFAGVELELDPHEQRTLVTGFTGQGRRGIYTPDLVVIEDADGAVLQERADPREKYPVRDENLRWDDLHALYFGGYAMWNYLTTPYTLTRPGVRTEELEPFRAENGEDWRRLKVTYPPEITVHSTEQTFYFDAAGLQRRVDYAPYVLGSRPAAHFTEAHRTVSGLVFPTHRYVRSIVDGRLDQRIIVIDFEDFAVEFDDLPAASNECSSDSIPASSRQGHCTRLT